MNKAELIQAVSAYYDGSKSEAAKALNAVVETITYKTAAGEKVSITGFGVFEKVHRSARMVRNPRTGERKRAKATAVPRFRAGSDLKAYVSGAKKVPKATARKATPAKAAVAPRKAVAKPAAKKPPRPRRPLPSASTASVGKSRIPRAIARAVQNREQCKIQYSAIARRRAPGHRPPPRVAAGRGGRAGVRRRAHWPVAQSVFRLR